MTRESTINIISIAVAITLGYTFFGDAQGIFSYILYGGIGGIIGFVINVVIDKSFPTYLSNIRLTKDTKRFMAIIFIILMISLFVYPTPYHYSMFDGKYPVKMNSITGKAWILQGTKWIEIKRNSEETS